MNVLYSANEIQTESSLDTSRSSDVLSGSGYFVVLLKDGKKVLLHASNPIHFTVFPVGEKSLPTEKLRSCFEVRPAYVN